MICELSTSDVCENCQQKGHLKHLCPSPLPISKPSPHHTCPCDNLYYGSISHGFIDKIDVKLSLLYSQQKLIVDGEKHNNVFV